MLEPTISAGKELGKQAAEEMKEKGITSGSIAIVCVDVSQPTMIDREAGIKADLKRSMAQMRVISNF